MNRVSILLLMTALVVGCSNKGLYQFGQQYSKSSCIERAETVWQLEECREREARSFEEYEQLKKELKNDQKKSKN